MTFQLCPIDFNIVKLSNKVFVM